jgi:hypothetical protein
MATPTVPADRKEMAKILQRARQGDESVLPAVRAMLRDAGAVDRLGGDLPRMPEQALIRAATDENLSFREALIRKLDLLRDELAGPAPAPLERLLVDRIVACWLQLHIGDLFLAQKEGTLKVAQAEYHERTRDRAQQRYLAAIKTLALVRKLALPVLQVNIAKKQVNVAGPYPAVDAERGSP